MNQNPLILDWGDDPPRFDPTATPMTAEADVQYRPLPTPGKEHTMTRVSERHLIQQVDDNLVFVDEDSGVEVVKPVAEAQIVLDKFRLAAEEDRALTLRNADEEQSWFLPADYYPGVERALNYFIDNAGVRQARTLDDTLSEFRVIEE